MKSRVVYLIMAAVLLGVVFTGCGSSKESGNHAEVPDTEISQTVEEEEKNEQEQASETIEVVEDATMTEEEDGSKTYETEEAHTHSYTASSTTEATCTANGVKTFTCTCGSSYTKDIDKLSHTAGEWKVVKEATCTVDGTKAKTCTSCGTQVESETIAKTGHAAGEWKITKNATCKEEGTKVRKCTSCDAQIETDTIAKTEHTSGDWVITKEATCNTNGSKHKVCTICGAETAVEAITANGTHSYSWNTNGDTRTMKCACGVTGITEYKYGSVWGYFDDAAAEELWNLINAQRNKTWIGLLDPFGNPAGSTYVSSLNKKDDLFAKAKKRAPEVALSFSHNGEQHECLAGGMATAREAMDDWMFSDSHRQALTNPDYTIGGIACFWYDSAGDGNCYPIWVFELGY